MKNRALNESEVESLLASAADEFTNALNHGLNPEVEEYARRYTQIAGSIRRLFPAMAALDGKRVSHDADDSMSQRPFKQLGEFAIVGELGRGGMGVVYRAEQESLGRTVALKVLPVSALLDDKQLVRFKNEARAAATLSHPNIVPVYSVGVERGVHYYAMRLIDGQTMAEVIENLCRDKKAFESTHLGKIASGPTLRSPSSRATGVRATGANAERHGDGIQGELDDLALVDPNGAPSPEATPALPKGSPQNAMESSNLNDSTSSNAKFYRNVAILGVQAADAIEHAHSHGILHRDIKPANLMIDHEGHLWVTDFGVARLENDNSMTATGDLLGTIRYMSPEQAIGDRVIDQRADVYSLGVTLYELLTQRPAVDGNDRLDLLQKIAHEDPVPPRRIATSIPVDLETIVLKAIEKVPDDRYATAQALADDLQCFLESRPIKARPPSMVDLATKWTRRHQAIVWAGIATMTLALITLACSTFLIGKAYRSAENQRERAETNLRLAREVIDNVYAKEIELLRDEPGMTSKQREFLGTIAQFYQKLPERELQDESLLHKACEARRSLGEILRVLGRHDEAIRNFNSAIEIANRLHQRFPQRNEYQRTLAMSHDGLGKTLRQQQKMSSAVGAHRIAMRMADELLQAEPDNVAIQRLATQRLNLALAIQESQLRETTLRETIRSVESLSKKFPDETEFVSCKARSLDHLGSLLAATGRKREAESEFRKSLEIQIALGKSHPAIPGFRYQAAKIQNHLAVILSGQGRLQQAEKTIRDATQALKQLANDFPHRVAYHFELAQFHTELGRLQIELEHFDEARKSFGEAVDVLIPLAKSETVTPEIRTALVINHGLLGEVGYLSNQRQETTKQYQLAYSIAEKLAEEFPNDPEIQFRFAQSRAQLARVIQPQYRDEQYQAAVNSMRELAKRFPERVKYSNLLVKLLGGHSSVLRQLGRAEEAEEQTLAGIEVANRFADQFPEESKFLWTGDLSAQLGEFADAVTAHQSASENYRRLVKEYPERPRYRIDLATSLKRLANSQVRVGEYQSALKNYRETIAITEKLTIDHPHIAAYHNKVERRHKLLGDLYLGMGKLDQAAEAYTLTLRRARKIRESFPDYPQSIPGIIKTHVRLANILVDLNPRRQAEAEQELLHAIELCDHVGASTVRIPLMCDLANIVSIADEPKTPMAEESRRRAKELLIEAASRIDRLIEVARSSGKDSSHVRLIRWRVANELVRIGEKELAESIISRLLSDPVPANAFALQQHAWYLANTCQSSELRLAQSFEWATSAAKMAPTKSAMQSTVALAQFRSQQFDSALKTLNPSNSLKGNHIALNSLLLTLIKSKLGRHEEAEQHFAMARRTLLFADALKLVEYRRMRDEAFVALKQAAQEKGLPLEVTTHVKLSDE